MSSKTPLALVCLFIACAAIANLVRFLWNIELCIGSFILPGWTGAIFFILFGLLAAWAFRSLYLSNQPPTSPSPR